MSRAADNTERTHATDNTSGDPPPVPEPGRPVAYAPFYRSQRRDARAVERATIPVEKIRGPVQLVSGVDDQMLPSSDMALRRLETHRHPFPFRHLKYPEAGHTILVPYWPLRELRVLTLARVEGAQDYLLFQGGSAKADAEVGVDAWRDLFTSLGLRVHLHCPAPLREWQVAIWCSRRWDFSAKQLSPGKALSRWESLSLDVGIR